MTEPADDARSNPFSSRFIRPGAHRYLFDEQMSIAIVVERLRDANWRGQVVGPHGSGKSTLLADLVAALKTTERPVSVRLSLHDRQRRLPRDAWRAIRLVRSGVVCVDGYEQLNWFNRCRLQFTCWRRALGLVVTTHRDRGLPTIWTTRVDAESAMRVVRSLLNGRDLPIAQDWLAERLNSANGNLRDVLFDLYDLYEDRRQQVR